MELAVSQALESEELLGTNFTRFLCGRKAQQKSARLLVWSLSYINLSYNLDLVFSGLSYFICYLRITKPTKSKCCYKKGWILKKREKSTLKYRNTTAMLNNGYLVIPRYTGKEYPPSHQKTSELGTPAICRIIQYSGHING